MKARPPWQVFLFGGASGVGKTSVSYRLAQHYGVGITEVDDFHAILEGRTTPEQYPVLHYWRTHCEEARRMDAQRHVEFFRAYAATMAAALEMVIANHLESQTPIVLEGDCCWAAGQDAVPLPSDGVSVPLPSDAVSVPLQ